jgi:hypothetical protein
LTSRTTMSRCARAVSQPQSPVVVAHALPCTDNGRVVRGCERAKVRILPKEERQSLLDASRLSLLEHRLGNENDIGVGIGDSPHKTTCVSRIPAQNHRLHALHGGQID